MIVVRLCSHFRLAHGTVLVESEYICHHCFFSNLSSYDGYADSTSSYSLANIEMRLILAKMLWHFDFKLTPECANWPKDQYIYTSWEKIPLKVHITTRAGKA